MRTVCPQVTLELQRHALRECGVDDAALPTALRQLHSARHTYAHDDAFIASDGDAGNMRDAVFARGGEGGDEGGLGGNGAEAGIARGGETASE